MRNFQFGQGESRDEYRPDTHLGTVNTSSSANDIWRVGIVARLTGPGTWSISRLWDLRGTKLTKMSSEQCLLPGVDLRNPLIEREYSWDSTERHDPQEEENQFPRGDTQLGAIESLEVQPCTDVDKAGTVKHEVDDSRE